MFQDQLALRFRQAAAEGNHQVVLLMLGRGPRHTQAERNLVESQGAESKKTALHRTFESMVTLCDPDPSAAVRAIYFIEENLTTADLSDNQSKILSLYITAQYLLDCSPNLDITDREGVSARQLLGRLPEQISWALSQARLANDIGETIVTRVVNATPSMPN